MERKDIRYLRAVSKKHSSERSIQTGNGQRGSVTVWLDSRVKRATPIPDTLHRLTPDHTHIERDKSPPSTPLPFSSFPLLCTCTSPYNMEKCTDKK